MTTKETALIRVELPHPLAVLAGSPREVALEVAMPITQCSVLDALEQRYPMLRGTVRDQATHERRPFLRFFAAQRDLTHQPPDQPLPASVIAGREPLLILGAIAGG